MKLPNPKRVLLLTRRLKIIQGRIIRLRSLLRSVRIVGIRISLRMGRPQHKMVASAVMMIIRGSICRIVMVMNRIVLIVRIRRILIRQSVLHSLLGELFSKPEVMRIILRSIVRVVPRTGRDTGIRKVGLQVVNQWWVPLFGTVLVNQVRLRMVMWPS